MFIIATLLLVKEDGMIPTSYTQWKSCLVNDCKITLTPDFARSRLSVYEDPENRETQKFAQLFGKEHLQNGIGWFRQVVKTNKA